MEKPEPDTQLQFLDVAALQTMFGVGRSKARLMMDVLPSIRVGNKDYVSQKALTTSPPTAASPSAGPNAIDKNIGPVLLIGN